MKKFTFFIIALFVSGSINFINAQKKNEVTYQVPPIPLNDQTKLITYSGVVNSTGTATELYQKALRWFKTYYKNPTEVIREQNETEFSILGKSRFKYNNPADKNGVEAMAGILQYTIKFYAKEGRYKYEITDFNIKDVSYQPCEYWLDKTSQKYTVKCDYYLIQLDKEINGLIADLNKQMSGSSDKKDTNNNW